MAWVHGTGEQGPLTKAEDGTGVEDLSTSGHHMPPLRRKKNAQVSWGLLLHPSEHTSPTSGTAKQTFRAWP